MAFLKTIPLEEVEKAIEDIINSPAGESMIKISSAVVMVEPPEFPIDVKIPDITNDEVEEEAGGNGGLFAGIGAACVIAAVAGAGIFYMINGKP